MAAVVNRAHFGPSPGMARAARSEQTLSFPCPPSLTYTPDDEDNEDEDDDDDDDDDTHKHTCTHSHQRPDSAASSAQLSTV